MNGKKILLLVGALVIAAVAAVMAKNIFAGAGAQQANAAPVMPAGPKVLVAKKPLPVGTIIDAEALSYQAWPKELVQGAYFTEGSEGANASDMIGKVVRTAISAGQPITRGSLVGPEDRGFLAAALGPGMRAITVPVSATSGVAGFVFPGDRVDMVLTQEVASDAGPTLKVSETIVRNLRVLATDQRTSEAKDESGKVQVIQSSTVTIEVTPKIAEKIAVAQSIGQLSLALRSIADNTAELERAIASGEVDIADAANPDEERRMLLAVANRPVDTNPTFTTGGQVSRFQRSSLPPVAAAPAASSAPTAGEGPASAAPVYASGPSVRIARGNNVTVVPVGAR
ncbi:Flp pilus assembly protein CpaB [Sphingomicrobium lutaoense]|uniref:Pilus assembly protein CpaB n=1 Tax=Sphingomicrobium lutaoense TaxID=515949 RepID=A0A839Z064_9SPHN|nr:Flp pilus assembly protein CpaB [Sphingomicrobium lutaoense]MBB3763958.1 pilus assembly protein CpaB [Sphingomicrobium lutaoense]